MATALIRMLNRPRGRIVERLRIDQTLTAYFACSLLSTAIVAGLFVLALMGRIPFQGGWAEFNLGGFIAIGMMRWIAITIIGAIIGAPFVPVATWIGARLGIESVAYYLAAGGLSACAITYLLMGPPRETDFGTVMAAWLIGPPCGTAWAAAWWYLHRRWRTEGGQHS